MNLTLLGATGILGGPLLTQAIMRGDNVTVLVRDPAKLPPLPSSVNIVTGDYRDPHKLAEAVQGSDAVISTIGPPTSRRSPLTPIDFYHAMRVLIAILEEQRIERFVHIASTGTRFGNETLSWKRKFIQRALSLIAPVVIPAKELELEALAKSNLDWVSIRSPLIRNHVEGTFRVSEHETQGWQVDAKQLASFALEQASAVHCDKQAPFVGTR